MSVTTFSEQIGTGATVTPTAITCTLNSLATSATAGRQSTAVSLVDANGNVPQMIEIQALLTWATGTVGSDGCVYFFMARSIDGTHFESGPPNVGASDAAFTFTSSPVGTAPLPTDMMYLGSVVVNVASQSHNKIFRVPSPPRAFVIVALNYSGLSLASSGNSISYTSRYGDTP